MRLADNRSIEHLTITDSNITVTDSNTNDPNIASSKPGTEVDMLGILAPFVALNHNLRCIEMHSFNISMGIPSFISALGHLSMESCLERIDLSRCNIEDDVVRDLIDALNSSRGLYYLAELCLSSNVVGQLGCTAIAELFRKSECRIRTLELGDNALDDTCIIILVEAFLGNRTLKELVLEKQKFVTVKGWSVVSVCLLPTSSVAKLCLSSDCFQDVGFLNALFISSAVKRNTAQYHDSHAAIAGYKPPAEMDEDGYEGDTFQRILDNDPKVTHADLIYDELWGDQVEVAGTGISQSMHLRSLNISALLDNDENYEEILTFLTRVAENRSIEHFSLSGWYIYDDEDDDEEFPDIVPTIEKLSTFFAANRNLRCIEITDTDLSMGIPSLVSALVHSSREWRLERIDLTYSNIGDKGVGDFVDAIDNSPGLSSLSELCLSHNQVGQLGCTAIGKLLKNSECSVRTLELHNNALDDTCIVTIVDAFTFNNTLKHLELYHQPFVTSRGWCLFSAYLTFRACLLDKVRFHGDKLDDAALTCLGVTLAINKTVNHLEIRHSHFLDATPLGWRMFSTCLKRPDSVLRELDISGCNIKDDGAIVLTAALAENTTVKKLNMSNIRSISSSGWIDCLDMLLKSSALEYINLSKNGFDDEVAILLARLLGNGGNLRSLDVGENDYITLSGWRAIADALPSFSLNVLRLGDGRERAAVDNELIRNFATALARNTSLTTLDLDFTISDPAGNALFNALCDTSSIDNTFASNHTLHSLQFTSTQWWYETYKLSKMNSTCKDKFAVARNKILKYHFNDVDNCVHIFCPMETKVHPTVLSWIGRDQSGFPLMYNFLRSMPWLIKSADPDIKKLKPVEHAIEELDPVDPVIEELVPMVTRVLF